MLKVSFRYSPISEFGEYKFQYRPDVSNNALRYRFNYKINTGRSRYTFTYNIYADIHIEDSVLVDTKKNIDIEDSIVYLESLKSIDLKYDAYPLKKYTDSIKDLLVESNDNKLEDVNKIREWDMLHKSKDINMFFRDSYFHDDMEDIDIYDNHTDLDVKGVNHVRDFDINIDKKTNSMTSINKHYVSLDDNISSFVKNNKQDILITDLQNKLKDTTRDLYVELDDKVYQIYKQVVVDDGEFLASVNKDLEVDENSVYFDIDKNLETLEDVYFDIDKNIDIPSSNRLGLNKTREVSVSDSISKFKRKTDTDILLDDNVSRVEKNTKKEASIESGDTQVIDTLHQDIEIESSIESKLQSKTIDGAAVKDDNIGTMKKIVDEITNEVFYRFESNPSREIQDNDNKTSIVKAPKDLRLKEGVAINKASKDSDFEEDTTMGEASKDMESEDEDKPLSLHKRLWFLQHHGKVDYKVLPNTDFNYPINMNILDSPITDGIYKYSYTSYYSSLGGEYKVVAYDNDFNVIGINTVSLDENIVSKVEGIEVKTQIISYALDKHQINFDIRIYHDSVSYFVIKQPKDIYGDFFSFTIAEEILNEYHPIPIGRDLGIREIPIPIAIMVDFINVLLLMWSKFYLQFTGYQGVQAIDGLVDIVHDWVSLETSLEQESVEDYHRCFRWFRWECEKVRNKAKYDPDLSGNLWVEEVIYEMVDYMEMHHFDIVPEWYDIVNMDEHRNNLFTEVDFDIEVITDKLKGIRKRVLNKKSVN